MLGFTPPEWAYYASRHTGVEITQGAARTIDRNIRMEPQAALTKKGSVTEQRIHALIAAACHALDSGVSKSSTETPSPARKGRHQGGTRQPPIIGGTSACLIPCCFTSVFSAGPFAGHRDSISELVGDIVENSIEEVLSQAGISFRKTRRAESLPGFDQAPDFVIPNEFNPQVLIEAKLTEDDGHRSGQGNPRAASSLAQPGRQTTRSAPDSRWLPVSRDEASACAGKI